MDRLARYVAALTAAIVIGTGAAPPLAAQDAGDQIVETDVTPPAGDSEPDAAVEETPVAADETETDTADDANSAETDATDSETDSDADSTGETRAATETTDEAGDADPDDGPGASMVVVEDLNLREEADVEADVIQVMPAGTVVTLAGDGEAVNDFLPVDYGEDAGWAFLPFLVDEAQGDNLAVVTTELNLRAGPSVADDVITVMPEGAQVRVASLVTDDDGDDWNRVYYEETLAWARAEYVEFTDAPVETADPADETGTGAPGETPAAEASATGADLVTVADANLRAGSSLEDAVVSVVPFGAFAAVTGEAANGFVPVTVDGVAGWLSTAVIAPAEIATSLTGAVPADEGAATADAATVSGTPDDDEPRTTLSDLNLYAGPGEETEILLFVPAGETVTLTFDGYENGYAAVSYQGTAGWVWADLLQP